MTSASRAGVKVIARLAMASALLWLACGHEDSSPGPDGIALPGMPPGEPMRSMLMDDAAEEAPLPVREMTPEEQEMIVSGRFFNSQTPVFYGKVKRGSKVTVRLDEIESATITAHDGSWSYSPAHALDEGLHWIQAIVTDAAGQETLISEKDRFIIDTVPPDAPEVTAPGASVNTLTPAIGGRAEPGSTVTVLLDGTKAGEISADAAGTWSFTPAHGLSVGQHSVSATAMDAAENTSPPSATYSFSIKRSHYGWSCATAPAVSVTWAWVALALSLSRRHRARELQETSRRG